MNSDPVQVALLKPIQAHGDELAFLTLRRPTGLELRTIGVPMVFVSTGGETVDPDVTAALISELAGIPPSSVDKLSAGGYMAVTAALSEMVRGGPGDARADLAPREPTGADIRKFGVPIVFKGTVSAIHGPGMAAAIAVLCGIALAEVDALPAPAWMSVAATIVGFFRVDPAAGTTLTNS